MTLEDARQHITQWVETKLAVPSPAFNNLPPCPYSRPALTAGRVDIRCGDGAALVSTLREIARTWDDRFELIVMVCEPDTIDPEKLVVDMPQLNADLEAMDLISFFDHPQMQNPKFKVRTGNGKYLVAGIQRLSYFVKAAKPLYKKQYFAEVSKQFPVAKHVGQLSAP